MKTLGRLIASIALGYLLLVGGITLFQRDLIYLPASTAPVFEDYDLDGFGIITYQTADGLPQTAWYAPNKDNKPTLIIFHGNAGDLSGRAGLGRTLHQQGYGVLLTSYRGYPPNTGTPREIDIYADALAARAWLSQQQVADSQIVVFGASLGSGPATWLASRMAEEGKPARAVILEVPFSSLTDAAQYRYWYAPVDFLLQDRFDNLARIAGLRAPLLVLAAEYDDVVPNNLAKKLFDAALPPKEFVMVKGAAHNTVLDDSGQNFFYVMRFLATLE